MAAGDVITQAVRSCRGLRRSRLVRGCSGLSLDDRELEGTALQSGGTSSMRRGPCRAKKGEKLQLAMGPLTPSWS